MYRMYKKTCILLFTTLAVMYLDARDGVNGINGATLLAVGLVIATGFTIASEAKQEEAENRGKRSAN